MGRWAGEWVDEGGQKDGGGGCGDRGGYIEKMQILL